MKIHHISVWIALASLLQAEPYTLGQGLHLDPMLSVGGYFSSELAINRHDEHAGIDDVAVMAYGDINPMVSYLAELEAIGFYSKNFSNGEESGSQRFHIERLYADVWFADAFNFRLGKQISPIGYWNLEPINVLRDTTSSPLYSSRMFPKFLTGININGYVPQAEGMRYNLFAQKNHDFDEHYINIPNTHFFGLSMEKEFSTDWNGGGSVGEYITLSTSEKSRFLQGNVKYDNGEWGVTAEGIVANTDYQNGKSDYTAAAYTQGVYRFTPQHAIVGRYEYYNNRHDQYTDHIAIAGYSYRPIYPVSLKGEYQWHSQSDENRFLFSLSVLF